MLLAIDIGNTNITSAIFKGKKLIKQFDIPVKKYSQSKLAKKLPNYDQISASVICSVVPKLTKVIQSGLTKLTAKSPYIIGKHLIVPIKNRYRKPQQLGQDRLVNAYAASKLYGAPAIIIDTGTGITFDVVSKNNEYLGGLIFPGVGVLLASLAEKTALLPLIKIAKPKKLIGNDTKSSILSGIVFGISALSKELIGKIKQHAGKNSLVIGTGGDIDLIKKYSKLKIKIDKNLTLKGINLIYHNEIKKYV